MKVHLPKSNETYKANYDQLSEKLKSSKYVFSMEAVKIVYSTQIDNAT